MLNPFRSRELEPPSDKYCSDFHEAIQWISNYNEYSMFLELQPDLCKGLNAFLRCTNAPFNMQLGIADYTKIYYQYLTQ